MNIVGATRMFLIGKKLKDDFECAKRYAKSGDIDRARAATLRTIDGAEKIIRMSNSKKLRPLRQLSYQVLQSARLLAGQLDLGDEVDVVHVDIDDVEYIDLDLSSFVVEDDPKPRRRKKRKKKNIYGYSR